MTQSLQIIDFLLLFAYLSEKWGDFSALSYYNLALLHLLNKDNDKARFYFNKSKELGYKRSSFDELIHEAGSVLAKIQTDK